MEMDAQSRSALTATKHNLRYLYDPKTAPDAPSRRRTRTLLRALRSSLLFIFWRVVRYAKYAAIGSLVATVGAGAMAGTIMAATIWGAGKFALRVAYRRWGAGHEYGAMEEEEEEEEEEGRVQRLETGPEAVPW